MRPDLSVVTAAGVFGRLLKPLWGLLAALGGLLAASWRLLKVPGRLLGRLGGLLAAPGCLLTTSGRLWAALRGILRPLWAGPGGAPGSLLGRSGRHLRHCIKHCKNRVFYVFLGLRASPGGLWGDPGDLLAALRCVLGSPGPSWAGLGVSWTVLGGPVECPRAVGTHPAPRELLHLKSKSRLSRLLLISTIYPPAALWGHQAVEATLLATRL